MKLAPPTIYLWVTLWFINAVIGNYEPKVTVTEGKSTANFITYFDDFPNILSINENKIFISKDNGETWNEIKDIKFEKNSFIGIEMDKFDPKKAFIVSLGSKQYFTTDRGETWSSFEIDEAKGDGNQLTYPPKIIPNAVNPSLFLVEYLSCEQQSMFFEKCSKKYKYTTDLFKNIKSLGIDASSCAFAKSNKVFEPGKESTIYCISDKLNSFGHIVESNLIVSDDYFKSSDQLSHKLSKSGKLIDVRIEQTFLIAVVQNDKFNKKSKVTLLISKDGKEFNAADLQIDVAYGIMTFLDSSPLSLFLAVAGYTNFFNQVSLSTIYSSDSSGLRFKEVAKNVQNGDMVKVQTIDGTWISNVVDVDGPDKDDSSKSIVDALLGGGIHKNIKTQITFNDGADWQSVKLADDNCKGDDCTLHFFSPVEEDGSGKFVTGPTPAILMAVGNSGEALSLNLEEMNTYVSRNGGATWKKALDKPCVFAFGDLGNIIIATPFFGKNGSSSDILYFSLDQGESWSEMKLKHPFYPTTLLTTIDGTGTKFLASGLIDKTPDVPDDFEFSEVVYTIDFSEAYDKKCKSGDFEDVYARVTSDDEKPICIYGHREKFHRRKANSKCFAATLYEDITVYDESCQCSDHDFECALGFKPSKKGECEPDKEVIAEMCSSKKAKELTLPDKVLIAGDECTLKKSIKNFVAEHKLKCSDYVDKSEQSNKKIKTQKYKFEGKLREYTYFEQGEQYNGENVIVRTTDNRLYASRDGGIEFVKVPIYEQIVSYFMGLVPGQIVLATDSERLYTSKDAGNTYKKIDAPTRISSYMKSAIAFHKEETDKYIWFGDNGACNGDIFEGECSGIAYITEDDAESFKELRKDVVKCDFVSPFFKKQNKKDDKKDELIFCSVVDKSTNQINLVSSKNKFKDEKVLAKNVVGYAISGNYVIVGIVDEKKKTLKALVTEDGTTFAEAAMPHDLNIDIEQAFTLLDSETGSIFMHVTTQADDGSEYGAMLKSNSNGTSYSLALDHVNRNSKGYVDYDRVEGMEGILLSNVVSNYQSTDKKKLKTEISFNDGGEWNYITPPSTDSKGKKFKCGGKTLKDCSLNLFGFTDRKDYRDTYSSSSATGFMFGIGNVGPTLASKDLSSTFFTKDAGLTWKEVKKGVYMWEYGDRGSILVLIKDGKTDKLSYSLTEGDKWIDYKFSDSEVHVKDLATVPSDNSRKFLIFAEDDDQTVAFSIDFTDIYKRQCHLDLDHPDTDDFEYWSPKHPNLDNTCLFGHEAKYLRRASGHHDCFIGSAPLKDGFKVTKNCSCTRNDFECDYNYFRTSDNTCKLVKGLKPSDHKKEMCTNNAFEYFEPTGYRKIPLSTCVGGKQFDSFVPMPCPGKAKEFNKHYGREVGFGKLLLILGIPAFIFIFVTWFVYDRGIRRNGGFKQFGQIRLDDDEFEFNPIENNQVDKAVNTVVKGGIYVAATLIATFKTLRKVDKVMFDRLIGHFFRRRAGGRNYVSVPNIDEEEEELFGNFQDNYEEELEQGGADDLRQDFNDLDNEPVNLDSEQPSTSDSRLFDIDDQSDDDSKP